DESAAPPHTVRIPCAWDRSTTCPPGGGVLAKDRTEKRRRGPAPTPRAGAEQSPAETPHHRFRRSARPTAYARPARLPERRPPRPRTAPVRRASATCRRPSLRRRPTPTLRG